MIPLAAGYANPGMARREERKKEKKKKKDEIPKGNIHGLHDRMQVGGQHAGDERAAMLFVSHTPVMPLRPSRRTNS